MYATKVAQIGTSQLFFRETIKSIVSIAGYPHRHLVFRLVSLLVCCSLVIL